MYSFSRVYAFHDLPTPPPTRQALVFGLDPRGDEFQPEAVVQEIKFFNELPIFALKFENC